MSRNKEQVYDEEISPLMQKIIQICRENGIAALTSFNIGHDGEGPNGEDCTDLTCTTHLPDGDDGFDPRYNAAVRTIQVRHHTAVMHMTVGHGDGTQSHIAVLP